MSVLDLEVRFLIDQEVHSSIAIPQSLTEHINQAIIKAKEALIMELLRLGDISAGKAIELLQIDRDRLSQLMYDYHIPAWNWQDEDWEKELVAVNQELARLINVNSL